MKKSKVLIAYPPDFLSREKFVRKVEFFTRKIAIETFLIAGDPNGFAAEYAASIGIPCVVWTASDSPPTHAIIFSADDSFAELEARLFSLGVRGKRVNLKLATVANKDKGERFDIYIGRGTIWGNPYPIGVAGDREEVLRKYQYDFDQRYLKFFENHDENVEKLRGKVLGCHCKPAACHGDILAAYVNSLDDGE